MLAQTPGADQPGGGLENDGDSTPTAPIDDYIWALAVFGLIFVFMKYRAVQNNRIQG